MSIITRGLGGGGGIGGRFLNYRVDLFALYVQTASYGADMVVAPALPSSQIMAAHDVDLLVGANPTSSYRTSILVIDLNEFNEQWNEAFI